MDFGKLPHFIVLVFLLSLNLSSISLPIPVSKQLQRNRKWIEPPSKEWRKSLAHATQPKYQFRATNSIIDGAYNAGATLFVQFESEW